MAIATRNTTYDVTTTVTDIAGPYGDDEWTIGNAGGSIVFVQYCGSGGTTSFTGTETQLRALSQAEIGPFQRHIVPAGVRYAGIVTGTGHKSTAKVAAGVQDPPEPIYVPVKIDAAAAGTTLVVANPGADHQIWLYAAHCSLAAAGTATWEDSDGTDLSGIMAVGANGGFVWPHTNTPSGPWVKCTANKALHIILAGAGATGDGMAIYADVTV